MTGPRHDELTRAVIDAAKAWRDGRTVFGEFNGDFGGDDALVAAVDALRAAEQTDTEAP